MPVFLFFRGQRYEVSPGITLGAALVEMDVDPSAVLALRSGELISEDAVLVDSDSVKLIAVISGG